MNGILYPYTGVGFKNRKNPDLPSSQLRELLRSMIRIRRIEEKIAEEYPKDEIKNPVHLVIGQEATSVGLCAAMRKTDLLYLSHRTHGGYLAKGGDLRAMMAELYCKITGCVGSRGGSMHLVDKKVGVAGSSAIVAGAIPIATGAALAAKLKGEDRVVATLFGDAANEEGVTSESLNFAVLKKLPIVYFCENNFYSVQSPLSARQPITRMIDRAKGFGIATEECDGSNVLDVYEASARAIDRARDGGGPTFIEAPVYRWLAHAGDKDDSATGYRSLDERKQWETNACPIRLARDYFLRIDAIDPSWLDVTEQEIAVEIEEAFDYAKKSPVPGKTDLMRHGYALG